MTGVMAYLSAPLWFLFLAAVDRAARRAHAGRCRSTSSSRTSSFRCGPSGIPSGRCSLVGGTAVLLFLPKILARAARRCGAARALRRPRRGSSRACCCEIVAVRAARADPHAVPHAVRRDARCIGLRGARGSRRRARTRRRPGARRCAATACTRLIGVAWAGVVVLARSAFLWWLLPVAGALIAVDSAVGVHEPRLARAPGAAARASSSFPRKCSRRARSAPRGATCGTRPRRRGRSPTPCSIRDVNALACAMAIDRRRLPATVRQRPRGAGARRRHSSAPRALSAEQKTAPARRSAGRCRGCIRTCGSPARRNLTPLAFLTTRHARRRQPAGLRRCCEIDLEWR